MELHLDAAGRLWAYCDDCGFGGDGVDLMKFARKTSTVHDTMQELIRCSGINAAEVTRERMLTYSCETEMREEFAAFWAECQQNARNMYVDVQMFEALGIFPDFNRGVINGILPHIGSCTGRALSSALGIKSPLSPRRLVTILPFCNMPGLPTAIAILYMKANRLQVTYRELGTGGDSGLCAFSNLRDATQCIMVDDPLDMLRLTYTAGLSSSTSIPVVAYLDKTTVWPIVNKVPIFYSESLSIRLLRRAKGLQGSKVCTKRDIPDLRSAHVLCSDIQRNAVPWFVAVRNIIRGLPFLDAERTLLSLELTAEEADDILETIDDPEEKAQFKILLGHAVGCRVARLGDRTEVIQTDTGWYKSSQSEDRVRVSNVSFTIDSCVVYPSVGTFYSGMICVAGRRPLKYTANSTDIVDRTQEWLRGMLNENGLGQLNVLRGWTTRLWELAQLFSPSMTQAIGKESSGWNQDGSFSIGNVCIQNGQLAHAETTVGINTPMSRLASVTPDNKTLDQLRTPKYENQLLWALSAAVLTSVYYRLDDQAMPRITVICGDNVLRKFVNDLNLTASTFDNGIPGFCKFQDITWDTKNVITGTGWADAHAVRGRHTTYLPLPYEPTQIAGSWAGAAPVIMKAIAYMQADPTSGPVNALQSAMVELTGMPTDVVGDGVAMLRYGTPYGSDVTPGRLMLYTLFSFIQEERVRVSSYAGTKNVTTSGDNMLVPFTLLRTIPTGVQRESVEADLHAIGALVNATDFEFVLDRQAWSTELKCWRKLALL